MTRIRFFSTGLGVFLFLLTLSTDAAPLMAGQTYRPNTKEAPKNVPAAEPELEKPQPALVPAAPEPATQVTLSALRTTTSWDQNDPDRDKFELPLLTLHRQRDVTPQADRLLEIQITGVEARTAVQTQVISHHAKTWTGRRPSETRSFVTPDRPCTLDAPCTFQWTFDADELPSDFYHLRMLDSTGDTLWENPISDRPDFVALDTWDVNVADAPEEPGSSYTARVHYATLFPFARDHRNPGDYLSPDAVTDFVENQFVPIIHETWQTQLHDWGFGVPLHPDWDADGIVDIIITTPPFALFDGTGMYTRFFDGNGRPYPERRIWLLSSVDNFLAYDSLENGYRATFAHEFFHLAQFNVLLLAGAGSTQPGGFWQNTFIEAQGKFAPTVQYPELELHTTGFLKDDNGYGRSADRFLTARMNVSYRDLEDERQHRYDLTLYWRFLYEQYGDMGIIRASLEEMTRLHDPDILVSMEQVMDAAFARLDGPFQTFDESLIVFANANYALRLGNGRCASKVQAECRGFYYDPDGMYVFPRLAAERTYHGDRMSHDGSIPTSYGMDFVEVGLDPALSGQPLTVRVHGEEATTQLNVAVWRLGSKKGISHALTEAPEIATQSGNGGAHTFTLSGQQMTDCDRLALIITRLDTQETVDPDGSYQVTVDVAGRMP